MPSSVQGSGTRVTVAKNKRVCLKILQLKGKRQTEQLNRKFRVLVSVMKEIRYEKR